jgi:hypothetical protein
MVSKGGIFNNSAFNFGANKFPNGIEMATIDRINHWFSPAQNSYPTSHPNPNESNPGTYHGTVIINGNIFYI